MPLPCAAFISISPLPGVLASPSARISARPRRRPRTAQVCMGLRSRLGDLLASRAESGAGKDGAAEGEVNAAAGKDEKDEQDLPPPGLMLSSLLGELESVAGGDMSGRLGQAMSEAKRRLGAGKETLLTGLAGGGGDGLEDGVEDGAKTFCGLLASKEVTAAVDRLKKLSGGAKFVGGAAAMAMQAVGMGSDVDEDSADYLEDHVGTPKSPAFEPLTALVLAGYGFQAYLEPARGAYWEAHCAAVPAAGKSGREEQTIMTRVGYPSTEAISRTALGVFVVQCEPAVLAEGVKPLDAGFYVTTVLTGGGIFNGDVLSDDGPVNFSLLRRGAGKSLEDAVERDGGNFLSFYVYESEAAFLTGGAKLASGRYALDEIIDASKGQAGGARGGKDAVLFHAHHAEDDEANFFDSVSLPKGMSLPFGLSLPSAKSAREKANEKVAGASLTLQVSYMPFDMPDGYDASDDDDDDEDDEEEGLSEEQALAISDAMSEGDVPMMDWQKLVKQLHEVITELPETSSLLPDDLVSEDLSAARFIMSPDTDSEVWFFHDDFKKHVVVSYRGTEQAWTPGDQPNLDIESGRTMGLDIWDVLAEGSKKGKIDDVSAMSCCHWGFLRAFLSLRDCVDETLHELTDGFSEGYSIFFVGHSLGGALATLSAADTAQRHGRGTGNDDLNVSLINFGSPRVGNRAFARQFNALVPNAFRIVNGADLVARMPQTPSRLRGGFRHVGRTVLVAEDGEIWTQGEHGGDVSNSFPEPSMEKLSGLLAKEREMWELLVSGKSLGHHMEDSYFVAMREVVKKLAS